MRERSSIALPMNINDGALSACRYLNVRNCERRWLWRSINGVHSSYIVLQVNDRLSKPSGKVCGMIWSNSSVGKPVRVGIVMAALKLEYRRKRPR